MGSTCSLRYHLPFEQSSDGKEFALLHQWTVVNTGNHTGKGESWEIIWSPTSWCVCHYYWCLISRLSLSWWGLLKSTGTESCPQPSFHSWGKNSISRINFLKRLRAVCGFPGLLGPVVETRNQFCCDETVKNKFSQKPLPSKGIVQVVSAFPSAQGTWCIWCM